MQALLIGCGKMGGALLSQWVRAENTEYTIVDPALETAPQGVKLLSAADTIEGQTFDIMIVAIKPQLIDSVLPAYKEMLKPTGVLASIAAGCSVDRLQTAMGQVPVVRIMPNLPAAIGKGVAGLYGSPETDDNNRKKIEDLMSLTGSTVWVDSEDGLDKVTAIAGSGPGYVFEIARTYVEAATELGFSEAQARTLVLGTLAGTIEMAKASDDSLATLRDNVTSKNGTTYAGLQALNADKTLSDLLKATVKAAYARAVELR